MLDNKSKSSIPRYLCCSCSSDICSSSFKRKYLSSLSSLEPSYRLSSRSWISLMDRKRPGNKWISLNVEAIRGRISQLIFQSFLLLLTIESNYFVKCTFWYFKLASAVILGKNSWFLYWRAAVTVTRREQGGQGGGEGAGKGKEEGNEKQQLNEWFSITTR